MVSTPVGPPMSSFSSNQTISSFSSNQTISALSSTSSSSNRFFILSDLKKQKDPLLIMKNAMLIGVEDKKISPNAKFGPLMILSDTYDMSLGRRPQDRNSYKGYRRNDDRRKVDRREKKCSSTFASPSKSLTWIGYKLACVSNICSLIEKKNTFENKKRILEVITSLLKGTRILTSQELIIGLTWLKVNKLICSPYLKGKT